MYHSEQQVRFFEEVFDETHEKIVAFNVILFLFRIKVIKLEGNQLAHNPVLADQFSS